jgi:hypothetical protein
MVHNATLKNLGKVKETVELIDRDDGGVANPAPGESVHDDDQLLCFGNLENLSHVAQDSDDVTGERQTERGEQ